MVFVYAFILGGVLCLIGQALLMFAKLKPPVLLIGLIALSALAAPFGITPALEAWGGAGIIIMACDFGVAMYNATLALLSGNPLMLVTLIAMFLILACFGIAGGAIRCTKRKEEAVSQEA